ncbi:hypothetical protein Hanom_Chr04g00303151 [Helianthus anomalus]
MQFFMNTPAISCITPARALFSKLDSVYSEARARLVYYLLINILNKNNINNRLV